MRDPWLPLPHGNSHEWILTLACAGVTHTRTHDAEPGSERVETASAVNAEDILGAPHFICESDVLLQE